MMCGILVLVGLLMLITVLFCFMAEEITSVSVVLGDSNEKVQLHYAGSADYIMNSSVCNSHCSGREVSQ